MKCRSTPCILSVLWSGLTGSVWVAQGGPSPLLIESNAAAHHPRHDIRPLGRLRMGGGRIPLPPKVLCVFNPVVTVSGPDLFQMS